MNETNETQVTFKLAGPPLQQLDELARKTDRSRHLAARELMLQGLKNSEQGMLECTDFITKRLDELKSAAEEDRQLTQQLAQYVSALAEQCDQIAQVVSGLHELQEALRQDVATGVLALLVQGGQPADKAMEWVQRNLYVRG